MQLQDRTLAIDVLRGLTLALMIVVNMSINDTLSYAPLLHAVWHGLTLTDLVFPTFLFVAGLAIAFTLDALEAQGTPQVLRKVLGRTALIFLCGFLMYWFPFVGMDAQGHPFLLPIAHTRIPGVLQRIALGYGFAALILHFGKARGALAFSAVALLGYWALLSAFGDLTLTGNAELKLDKLLLGDDHLYHGEGIAFDPEGILSTLPAIVNVIAGCFAGRLVRRLGNGYETIARLMLAGAVCGAVALAWSGVLPFNKKLWTSSYVLVTIAIDLQLLALLVYAIELRGWRGWTYFFEVFGRNTLFIYLLSELAGTVMGLIHPGGKDLNLFDWLYVNVFQGWIGDKPGSLLYSLSFMLCCWGVGYVLDKRRIYIRL